MSNKFIETPYNQVSEQFKEELSITPSGRLGISKSFALRNDISRGKRARLFWDDSNKTIAIIFVNDKNEAAYPIGFTKQYGAYIVAGKFFKIRKLDAKQYVGKYDYKTMSAQSLKLANSGRVFILELKRVSSGTS